MKLEVYHNYKKTRISVDEFSVPQLERLLKMHFEYSKLVEEYPEKYKKVKEYIAQERKKVEMLKKPLTETLYKLEDRLKDYKLTFGLFHKNKIEYAGSSYKIEAKGLIDEIIKIIDQRLELYTKDDELYQKDRSMSETRPELLSINLKLINKSVTIYSTCNTYDEITRALEYKNKKEAIVAKAASFDGTQRQRADSIKNDIKSQIHVLSVCPYCGIDLSIRGAHADHIYPVSKGGLSTVRNMVYICSSCNIKKRDMTLRNFIKEYSLNEEKIHHHLDQLGKDF